MCTFIKAHVDLIACVYVNISNKQMCEMSRMYRASYHQCEHVSVVLEYYMKLKPNMHVCMYVQHLVFRKSHVCMFFQHLVLSRKFYDTLLTH